jgi:hypothetical protein
MSQEMERDMLRATVSGSFHRHMTAIYEAVGELRTRGVDVLSPSDPRVVDHIGEFLFVASDRLRSIKLVQDRHFEAIRQSDFLWVVSPDGYTGPSTSMEIGAAHLAGVPVYTTGIVLDITVGEYVRRVSSFSEAIRLSRAAARSTPPTHHILLDPRHAIGQTIDALDGLLPKLDGRIGDRGHDSERAFNETKKHLKGLFGEPWRDA